MVDITSAPGLRLSGTGIAEKYPYTLFVTSTQ